MRLFSRARPRPQLLSQMLLAVVLANMNPVFAKVLFAEGWAPMELYFAVLLVIVVALLIHEVIVIEQGGRWGMTREDIVGTVIAAVFGGFVSPILMYRGLHYVTASEAIILTSILPFFVVCFAVLMLGERFTLKELFGGALLTGGLVVLLWNDFLAFRLSPGVAMMVGASAASAFTIISHKKMVKHRHLDSVILARNVLSLLLMTSWMFFMEEDGFAFIGEERNIWIFLALPVCSYILPYFLYFPALMKLTAMDAGIMEAVGRVVGLIAAGAILGEVITERHILSMVCVIFGLLLVNVPLTKWRIVPSRLMGVEPLRK